jgi:hypothetical protein
MSDVRRLGAAALVATLALVAVSSCEGQPSAAPSSTPTPSSTPLASLDPSTLVVRRDAFCSGLGPDVLTQALGTADYDGHSYGNGDPAWLTESVKDVSHEFDCTWQAVDGTRARAWVFAPPVTPGQARRLAREAAAARGCGSLPGGLAFGRPSTGLLCQADGALEASYRGLFGDAWLSCSLSVPVAGVDRAGLLDRARRWCVSVATAASGTAVD